MAEIEQWDGMALEAFEKAGGAPLARREFMLGVPIDQFEDNASREWLKSAEERGLVERQASGVPTRWAMTAAGERRLEELR